MRISLAVPLLKELTIIIVYLGVVQKQLPNSKVREQLHCELDAVQLHPKQELIFTRVLSKRIGMSIHYAA